MKRPSQFSSDKRQATSDKRQATRDKRQATSDKQLNSLTNLFAALTAIILAVTLSACGGGGGGGGGGAVTSGFHKAQRDEVHNGGDSGGWGKGIETTSGSSSLGRLPQEELDEELLFSTFPTFFSPIDHIDMTMYINETLVEGLTGLNSSTKKEVIPEIKVSDKVSGTANYASRRKRAQRSDWHDLCRHRHNKDCAIHRIQIQDYGQRFSGRRRFVLYDRPA